MKTCSRCRKAKPFAAFSRSRSSISGLYAYCCWCASADNTRRYEARRQRRLAEGSGETLALASCLHGVVAPVFTDRRLVGLAVAGMGVAQ